MRACRSHPIGSPLVDATDFALEVHDRNEKPPQLSTYANGPTQATDLRVLVGPKVNVIARVYVAEVVKITLPSGEKHLCVKWSTTYFPPGTTAIDPRQGAEGHASIIGLDLPVDGEGHKKIRKDIRHLLATIALKNGVLSID